MAGDNSDARQSVEPSDGPLGRAHDTFLVDLDGVAYLGDQPISGAAEALRAVREQGAAVVFVTNNAARPPAEVVEQLESMGVAAAPGEVMTSAIAAARVAAERYPPGSPVLVVGGVGVREALSDVGLQPVTTADREPVAVVQGFAPEVGWKVLAEASVALRAGAAWIATNNDATLPSPRGPLPGNGSLVAALAAATGLTPEVIGKPAPALFTAALDASHGSRPLVVGDRLDTDIAGATAAGLPSLLVLSGVSTALDLLQAAPDMRPSYVGRDLRTLELVHPGVEVQDGEARVAASTATPDGLDRLRELCALVWSGARDATSFEPDLRELDLT
jgi:HAD superfamily hydrolase (TIGR01450 family)